MLRTMSFETASNRDDLLKSLAERLEQQGASVDRADDRLSARFGSAFGYRFWGRLLSSERLPIDMRVTVEEVTPQSPRSRVNVHVELTSREGFYVFDGRMNQRIFSTRMDELISGVGLAVGSVT